MAEQDNDLQIDMDAALASMDADFAADDDFGGSGSELETPAPPPTSVPRTATPTTPSAQPQGLQPPAPAPEPWKAPPKAWKKEMHDKYGTLPPEVMQYLHQREQEALEGIMQYKNPLDEYNKVFDHYKPWFEAHKITPMDAFTRLANSHIALLGQGVEPEVRQKYLQALIQDYGLEDMLRQMYGQPQQPGQGPDVEKLLRERLGPVQQQLRQIEQQRQQEQQARQQEELRAIQSEIDKFVASPENEFAGELIQDMVKLVQAGLATDLKGAYEQACRLNPSVSAKLLQREIEKATKPTKQPPRNVRSGSDTAASTKPGADEDLDATMLRTYKEITSRA